MVVKKYKSLYSILGMGKDKDNAERRTHTTPHVFISDPKSVGTDL
jgi:hypothetical protein